MNTIILKVPLLFMCVALMAGCASITQQSQSKPVPEIRPGILQGYLPVKQLPDSLRLLPSPPAEGSAAVKLDTKISTSSLTLSGSPHWKIAKSDANLKFPQAAGSFACALKVPITELYTPHLYLLLRRSLADAGLSTVRAKDHYQRKRPFMVNKKPTCTPYDEPVLSTSGSYPSGHAAIGWAWALILAEIAPSRADAILARGRAFGQNRVVCNVHWQSDVIEGRLMGAAVVARLHANPKFRADLDAAKAEFAAIIHKNLPLKRNCQVERQALSEVPANAPWPANK